MQTSAFPSLIGPGVNAMPTEVLMYFKSVGQKTLLHTASSQNGTEIHTHKDHPVILDERGKEIDPSAIHDFRFSVIDGLFVALFTKNSNLSRSVFLATSTDHLTWNLKGSLVGVKEIGTIVSGHRVNGKYILYFGEHDIYVATSDDLIHWDVSPNPVLRHFEDQFGVMALSIGTALPTQNGLLVVFFSTGREGSGLHYSLHAAFFDLLDPSKLLKRSQTLWEQSDEWSASKVKPVGVVYYEKKLISYWDFHKEGFFAIAHTSLKHHILKNTIRATDLQRIVQNPILTPISAHYWESKAVFNPAAIMENGKVHLLYRAIGDSDQSMLGYAASSDGIHFSERQETPAYIPRANFEGANQTSAHSESGYDSPYVSGGGGWGGCEDPRLTRLDDRLYLTYVAYDGWSPPRVALSSITVEDFLQQVWKWRDPVLISPPGVVDKNAVIFPEKVNGKYVILHRIFPNILLDFVDSLEDFDGKTFLKGEHAIRPSRTGWDNRKIGAGAPPIKTKDGWLLIYHSVGEEDPGKYKMGAMLLDLQDPTRVLCRTLSPILAPDDFHENNGWKSGVAYPCGAVVIGDTLYVYYGGADTVVCTATANLDQFLSELKDTGKVHLNPVSIHTRHKLL